MTISARHLSAWKQQPAESAEAYLAFSIYRDLGPWRSARQAYRKWRGSAAGGGPARPALSGAWKRWHKKWRWQERAFACDQEIDRQQRAARGARGGQSRLRDRQTKGPKSAGDAPVRPAGARA